MLLPQSRADSRNVLPHRFKIANTGPDRFISALLSTSYVRVVGGFHRITGCRPCFHPSLTANR